MRIRTYIGSAAAATGGIMAAGALLGAAHAAVTFDPVTGTGFAGKGDVQLAFGWNNAALQNNASGVSFTYQTVETFEYVCEWTTGPEHNRKIHTVTRETTTGVNSAVAYDARTRNQITGFTLKGFVPDSGSSTGDVPEVGDPCPGNPGTGAVVTEVTEDETAGSGGLYVNYGTSSVLIWP